MKFEDQIDNVFDFNLKEEVENYEEVINEGILDNIIQKAISKLADVADEIFAKQPDEVLKVANEWARKLENYIFSESDEKEEKPITEDVGAALGEIAHFMSQVGWASAMGLGVVIALVALKTGLIKRGVDITGDIASKAIDYMKSKVGENPELKKMKEAQAKRKVGEKARREMAKKKAMPKKRGFPKAPPSDF